MRLSPVRMIRACLGAVLLTGAACWLAPVADASTSAWTGPTPYALPAGASAALTAIGFQGGSVATVAYGAGATVNVDTLSPDSVYEPQAQLAYGGAVTPSLAVAPDGAAVVAWSTAAGTYASYRPAGGGSWSAVAAIGPGSAQVSTAIGSDNLAVVSAVTGSAGSYAAQIESTSGSGWTQLPGRSGLASPHLWLGVDGSGDVESGWTSGSALETATLTAGAAAWGATQSTGGLAGTPLSVVLGGSELGALLSDNCLAAVIAPIGGSLPAPACVATAAPGQAELTSDGNGNLAAFWADSAGVMQSAAFGGGGPVLVASDIPTTATAGTAYTYDATFVDLWSTPGAVTWDFGDGTAAAVGAQTSHAWAAPGAYQVTVSDSDGQGNTTQQSFIVTVGGAAAATAPAPAPAGPLALQLAVTQSRRSWTLKHGTVFKITLTAPATVSLTFTRRGARKPAGTVRMSGQRGPQRIEFHGELSALRKLRPARYSVSITAGANGYVTAPVSLRFRVERKSAPVKKVKKVKKHARGVRAVDRSR